jgi:hypothetical protein
MINSHWSCDFYRKAKEEGFKFAVRQHIPNFSDAEASLHKLKDKEEMWTLPFVKRWEESEVFEGANLPKDHPESFEKWEVKKYEEDGEHLLICHLKNKSYWVVAYLMDLDNSGVELTSNNN